ncbi:MAG: hypothetical protein Salg2KO_13070 [Salibacteraceae bacterium]
MAAVVAQEDALNWKERPPYSGYWQQDVAYEIEAELDDLNEVIDGQLTLTYSNNSPDNLSELYFHLYQNAFDSNSYAEQMKNRVVKASRSRNGIEITSVSVNGKEMKAEIDNTIMLVRLDEELQSGKTAKIEIEFRTHFGEVHGRMKSYSQFGNKHFNVVHWYPRISVYDRKFGWTTDQHLGHEFYGDFGSFEVQITIPEHYVLDGTGILVNRDEVLPASLMEKLNLKNFSEKPWNEPPSTIIEPTAKTKTWVFSAKNVHDFAWTADPSYRIGLATAKLKSGVEVECIALAQEQHARGWQNAAEYTARIIELYSEDFGEYAYPKMIVADARDGMEYPMLTLDGGRDPYYRDLLAHEVGHNWFFGMVGNNETYRAALDEGFTQFLTSWCMEKLEGDTLSWDVRKTRFPATVTARNTRDAQVYHGYYRSAIGREDDPQLNTHSDKFEGRGYSQVYYKTATMLYNLQYVLGDSLFLAAMQNYFDEWKFCHPYFQDFQTSIIRFTGVDLVWFFDQWLYTTDKIDYAIKSFRKVDKRQYILEIERKGSMEMPLDIVLTDETGVTYDYHIPNTDFVKSTEAEILPKWMGWDGFNTTYTVVLDSIDKIRTVSIDASNRLADVYTLDNALPMPIEVSVDNFSYSYPSRSYQIEWHPSVWYNGYDGVKAGVEIKGDYFQTYHKFDLGLWFSTGIGQQVNGLEYVRFSDEFYRLQYRIEYSTPMRSIGDDLYFHWQSSFIDGLFRNSVGWKKNLSNGKTSLQQSFGGLYRPGFAGLNYLLYPGEWNRDRWNNFTDTQLDHIYRYGKRSMGHITGQVRTPFVFSDYNYGLLSLESVNHNRFWKLNWKTRVFGQMGFGDDWAPESQLFASGANPEAMQDNPWIRSAGYIPAGSQGFGTATGWFQSGGGLNLRGYNNYLLPETNHEGFVEYAYAGQSGLSFNTELEFDDLIKPWPRSKRWVDINTYLFADAGIINLSQSSTLKDWSELRADAGIGVAVNINQWGSFRDFGRTTLRADFPLWLNRPPASEEFLQFRWVVGIDRAF